MYENLSLYPKSVAERNLSALKKEFLRYDRLIIAFSGGLDSALLLAVASDVLGRNVLAVISDSPSVPRSEINSAIDFAKKTGARLKVVNTRETENEDYILNPVNRCYFCKTELYDHIEEVASEEGIRFIANGTNMDDLGDHRPGLVAADEHQVVSPLRDAGLKKDDIRVIAKMLGLEVWDKPPSPCLASRIPYGRKVTPEKLSQVEEAEEFVKGLGVKELRVRHFDDKAVLEVNPLFLQLVKDHYEVIVTKFNSIGFQDIEIKKFKSGSLNKLANIDAKREA
ncbi:MAG: ATP-dependent sacrificial sulfur transferase LarE [Bacteroidales bacterium]